MYSKRFNRTQLSDRHAARGLHIVVFILYGPTPMRIGKPTRISSWMPVYEKLIGGLDCGGLRIGIAVVSRFERKHPLLNFRSKLIHHACVFAAQNQVVVFAHQVE